MQSTYWGQMPFTDAMNYMGIADGASEFWGVALAARYVCTISLIATALMRFLYSYQ